MNSAGASIVSSDLADLENLYDEGRYVAAHALAAERFGPLADWRGGAAALVFGGRLAGNVGGERLSHVLTLRAWRRLSTDPEATSADRATAALFHAFHVFGRRGPLAARRWLRRPGVVAAFEAGADDTTRADLLCLHAHVAAAFRDADTAEARWQEACALTPTRAWTWHERAVLLVALDRYPEALEAARDALRLRPWYRPAVQQAALILTLLGRDDEAAALLEDALDPEKGGQESAAVAGQLAVVYAELQRPADALRALDRFEGLCPLLEERGRQSLASRRGEARLQLNDLPGAADAADALAATSFFHAKTAERLRDPERQSARRVTLPVPFVRQHEKTCAPATLAALSHFWGRPANQADITRDIWYGGTLDHQERFWAETHGWVAREFRADWASAVAVLDLGVPFALVTTGVNTGHLQAGIGYDARRGTLIIRDPFERNQSEPLAEEFFAGFAFCGPRAMAMVPVADAELVARLRAVDLPEATLHDEVYNLRRALAVHDRPSARRALDALEAIDPAARLTLFGRRELAIYDGDDPALLAAVEGLLALFPHESRLRLEKLYTLRRLARPAEAHAWLETCVADPTQSEPNLWRELAVELAADARQLSRARQWLARALFYQPTEPAHLHALADICWDERDFEEGVALFRLAACAATTREDFWREFFTASRYLRETDAALRLLDARFRRLGEHSAQPARTLYWAHRERHDPAPASAVLAEALARRPDDGEMLLFAATAHARDGEHERAADALEAARGKASPGAFARAAAELCGLRGDLVGALVHWRSVLAREPLDGAAHHAVARLIAETDSRGPVAAREALDAAVARFPHAIALHELRVQWLLNDPGRGSAEHVAAVDALLTVQPIHIWAIRERALAFLARHDPAAALEVLDEAERLHPLAPATQALRGRALLIQGEREAAQTCLRRALTLDADLAGVIAALLDSYISPLDKRGALDFVHGELIRQSGGTGEGVLAYRTAAYAYLAEDDLQARLDAVLAARPDLWHAWSAVVWQHADAGRLDEAHARAKTASERFPLLARAWMDLAAVERIRGDTDAQIDALTHALRPRADHADASRQLAAAHRRAGRFAEARAVLERAIAAAPLDVGNRGALAETYWQEDRRQHGGRALEILVDAVSREPGYDWGWSALDQYATALGQSERLEGTALLLTTTRPGEARSWMRLAQTLPGESGPALDERVAALDRALALNPRYDAAHDLRAVLLTGAGRFDEALAACNPPVYLGGTRPLILEGRAAWVLARRGDLPGARGKMRALLAREPGYEWGWRLLADWAESAGDKDEAMAASERLAFLAPHSAAPLGYLATARLNMGLRTEAKRDLAEAMRRDPAYSYAPVTLLRVQMEDGEFDAAEETLASLQTHHPGQLTHSRTALLATKRKDQARALRALEELVSVPPASGSGDGGLQEVAEAMSEAGWRDATDNVLRDAMQLPDGDGHPEAGSLWVRSRASKSAWLGLATEMDRLNFDEEKPRRALTAYIEMLGTHKQGRALRKAVRRWGPVLRLTTEGWGQTGYALVTCGSYKHAVAWLDEWRTRPDAQGWMLFNLAAALRARAEFDEAVAVNRHALTLAPDHTRARQAVWVALADAISNDPATLERAKSLYAEIAGRSEADGQPFVYLRGLTRQVLALRGQPELLQRKLAWKTARAELRVERQKAAASWRGSPAVRLADVRARRRMTHDARAWGAWIGLWLRAIVPRIAATEPRSRGSSRWWWIIVWIVIQLILAVARHGH